MNADVEHNPDCRWQRTTERECEYRATHHYCPHPAHACTCTPARAEADLNALLDQFYDHVRDYGYWSGAPSAEDPESVAQKNGAMLGFASVRKRLDAAIAALRADADVGATKRAAETFRLDWLAARHRAGQAEAQLAALTALLDGAGAQAGSTVVVRVTALLARMEDGR